MNEFRHHRASREIVFVAVPVPTAGSPQPFPSRRPPPYPSTQRAPWKPQRFIPAKQRRAEQIVNLMRELDRRAEDARQMLRPTNAAGLKAWLGWSKAA
jgi:hypothetical protein